MARVKIIPACRLKSWKDVDETLRQIAECERVKADLENNMNAEIAEITKTYAEMAAPVQEKIDHYSADICQYVTENRGDLKGKTKKLNFGSTGFRISTKLKYNKGVKSADVIAALERLGLKDCIKSTKTVIADNLKKKPRKVLVNVGAYLKETDGFWYETKSEVIQPVKEETT